MATDSVPSSGTEDVNAPATGTDADCRLELRLRCKNAGIPVEERAGIGGRQVLTVQLPSGRQKRPITVVSDDNVKRLLAIQFERITPLGNYTAYLDKSNGVIEAGLRSLTIGGLVSSLHESLLGLNPFRLDDAASAGARIELTSENLGQTIALGMSSPILAVIAGRPFSRPMVSIQITGVQTDRHDQALEYLERIANALLFEVDLLLGTPAALARVRSPMRRSGGRAVRGTRRDLHFPGNEYDQQAMSLYWHARSARGMPLLQFLAFYHSLEFYFPVYSQLEAQRRIRNILKDPGFQVDRDADLGRVLAVARTTGGRGFGDERSQLRATLQECLDVNELRSFVRADDARKEFFATKSKALGLSALPIDREEADLRGEVANRIHEIRCKIVHTNAGGDGDVDLLLPFSEEAEALGFDIDLIQYVSQRVLIASSRSMRAVGQ
jgi:hypothetical protein